MSAYLVRFTEEAESDLLRLYEFIFGRDSASELAEQALNSIQQAIEWLRISPFSCRKAMPDNPYLRELVIPFGVAGYVALFEIESERIVTILAVRHQRESDYH